MERWTETDMVHCGNDSCMGETDLLYERIRQRSDGTTGRDPSGSYRPSKCLKESSEERRLTWGALRRKLRGAKEAERVGKGFITNVLSCEVQLGPDSQRAQAHKLHSRSSP